MGIFIKAAATTPYEVVAAVGIMVYSKSLILFLLFPEIVFILARIVIPRIILIFVLFIEEE